MGCTGRGKTYIEMKNLEQNADVISMKCIEINFENNIESWL